MGNILTALTSEKETTPRRREKEYTSSFVANPRPEKKESFKYSSGILGDPTTFDYSDDILLAKAQIRKQQEKASREREYLSSLYYRQGLTIPVEKELPQLPKTSQVTTQISSKVLREPTTLDQWSILEAKAQVRKQEKISKVKENTTSLPHRSYSSTTVKSEKKTTSEIVKENDVTLLENFGNLTASNRDYVKKVTEIVRHILRNTQFVGVFGNWSCRHWPLLCDNEDEWQIQLDRESLKRYLRLTPEKKHDFFNKPCKECGKENMISSFFLCKKLPILVDRAVEIICRLEWNNHYRVFAYWECQRPQHAYGRGQQQHKWKSSYTWISLQKFIEKASANDFNRTDFYKQKCHECREMCSKCKDKPKKFRGCTKCDYEGAITKYECLVLSEGGGQPHKRWLCAKCQEGATCVRTDDNRRIRRNRNIILY